jgi:hypothetical protein
MTHPIDIPMQAAHLWLRGASLGVKAALLPFEVSARIAESVCERMSAPEAPALPASAPRRDVAEAAAGPGSKQRRRAARREPTPGQATRARRARSDAEARAAVETDPAPHVGAEIHVAEPWEGYAALSAAEIVDRLADADDAVRAAVRLYEGANGGREAVMHATEG